MAPPLLPLLFRSSGSKLRWRKHGGVVPFYKWRRSAPATVVAADESCAGSSIGRKLQSRQQQMAVNKCLVAVVELEGKESGATGWVSVYGINEKDGDGLPVAVIAEIKAEATKLQFG